MCIRDSHKLYHAVCQIAEILRDDRHRAEMRPQSVKQLHPGTLFPVPACSSPVSVRYRIILDVYKRQTELLDKVEGGAAVMNARKAKHGWIWTLFFSILSVLWVFPIVLVFINSFKKKAYISRAPFQIPTDKMFVGWDNYVNGCLLYTSRCV